jgi:hypothetical protein
MGQHQQEIVAGGALKRILLVLSVAALMAIMMVAMAAPAFAENTRSPGEKGQPRASGAEGHAIVIHCPADGGSRGNIVFNTQGAHRNNCDN